MCSPSRYASTDSVPCASAMAVSHPALRERVPSTFRRAAAEAMMLDMAELEQVSPESRFLNRELSWIEFNRRVLDEALDQTQPVLERLKFLSIFSTNLDEFFMIRVSGLQDQIDAEPDLLSPDGLTPAAQMHMISERLRPMLQTQSRCLLEEVLPALARSCVRIVSYAELAHHRRAELELFFEERVFPVLTPLSVDPSHPFPYISNISLNLGILLAPSGDDDDVPRFARVKIPPSVPRLVQIGSENTFVLVEDLISA